MRSNIYIDTYTIRAIMRREKSYPAFYAIGGCVMELRILHREVVVVLSSPTFFTKTGASSGSDFSCRADETFSGFGSRRKPPKLASWAMSAILRGIRSLRTYETFSSIIGVRRRVGEAAFGASITQIRFWNVVVSRQTVRRR